MKNAGISSVAAAEAILVRPGFAAAPDDRLNPVEQPFLVLRVNPIGPGFGSRFQVLRLVAIQGPERFTPPNPVGFQVPIPDHVMGRARKQLKPFFALAPRFFCAEAFQRSAAVVGQRLQHIQILLTVGLRHVLVNRKKAEHFVLRPDRDIHQRGRKPGAIAEQNIIGVPVGHTRTQDQLGPFLDHAPHGGAGSRSQIGRWNLRRPAIDRVDVQDRMNLILLG